MLIIKASAKPSKINGIGLFADENIPQGKVTWKFNPRFDIYFDPAEVATMSPEHQELFDKYAYLSKKSGKFVYSIDDSRFTNHSTRNNIDLIDLPDQSEPQGIANRDIEAGEELLVDYRSFDANEAISTESYINN